MVWMMFECDEAKNQASIEKHGVSFEDAELAFADPRRIIRQDAGHSTADEKRYYRIGQVGDRVATVVFPMRG